MRRGQIPGSAAGGQFAHHVQGPVIRRAFSAFLISGCFHHRPDHRPLTPTLGGDRAKRN
jgi:hypothetical protein